MTPEQARHEVMLSSFDEWNIPLGSQQAFADLLADYDRLVAERQQLVAGLQEMERSQRRLTNRLSRLIQAYRVKEQP